MVFCSEEGSSLFLEKRTRLGLMTTMVSSVEVFEVSAEVRGSLLQCAAGRMLVGGVSAGGVESAGGILVEVMGRNRLGSRMGVAGGGVGGGMGMLLRTGCGVGIAALGAGGVAIGCWRTGCAGNYKFFLLIIVNYS